MEELRSYLRQYYLAGTIFLSFYDQSDQYRNMESVKFCTFILEFWYSITKLLLVGYGKKANVLYVISFFLYAECPLHYDLVTAGLFRWNKNFFPLLYPSALLGFYEVLNTCSKSQSKVFCFQNRHAKEWG